MNVVSKSLPKEPLSLSKLTEEQLNQMIAKVEKAWLKLVQLYPEAQQLLNVEQAVS